MSEHLSILALDTYAQGGAREAEAHLQGCELCRQKLDAIRAEKAEFDRLKLPALLPAAVQRLEKKPWFAGLFAPALVFAAAAAIFLVWPRHHPGDELGIKGGAALQVVVKHGARIAPLHDGEKLAPGDELRFVVEPDGKRFLLVMSIDGAGQVSVYQPFGGTRSAPIEGRRVEIPGSVVLDAAPGPERLYAIFSDAPVAASSVAPQLAKLGPDAIRQGPSLNLPPGATSISTYFEKGAP